MTTDSLDRRSTSRCPLCQGPAVADSEAVDGIRCRNSSCRQNHLHVKCPRCGAQDISHAVFKAQKWNYTCSDCENKWTKDS